MNAPHINKSARSTSFIWPPAVQFFLNSTISVRTARNPSVLCRVMNFRNWRVRFSAFSGSLSPSAILIARHRTVDRCRNTGQGGSRYAYLAKSINTRVRLLSALIHANHASDIQLYDTNRMQVGIFGTIPSFLRKTGSWQSSKAYFQIFARISSGSQLNGHGLRLSTITSGGNILMSARNLFSNDSHFAPNSNQTLPLNLSSARRVMKKSGVSELVLC